jgi:hypothetical protein
VFQMKDLMLHVQPAGGMLLFPNTCRISGNDPNPDPKGHTGCERHSAHPAPDPHPNPNPVCEDSRGPSVACDRDRGPRRASGLDALRQALRASLVS